jgi:hypothetical protein
MVCSFGEKPSSGRKVSTALPREHVPDLEPSRREWVGFRELRRRPGMTNKGMGKRRTVGHQTAGRADPNSLDENDIASDVAGKNKLQGDDQKHVRNQRRAYPDQPAAKRRRNVA